MRLGEVLVEAGILTAEQVQRILAIQHDTHEPFGLLSERLFRVDPADVENAWATQYAQLTRQIDPSIQSYEERALDLVTRRQAWQFRVLPIRFDGEELVLATTRRHLPRALRFATKIIGVPVMLVLADPMALGEALCKRYPLPGLTPRSIDDESLDGLAERVRSRKCA